MPVVQKPIYEQVTGAVGVTSISITEVPEGKSRIIMRGSGSHSDAAGVPLEWLLSLDGSRYMTVQQSAQGYHQGAANPGIVPQSERYPLIQVPLVMVSGNILSLLGNVGAGAFLQMMVIYFEWYHDFEPIPWQVRLL